MLNRTGYFRIAVLECAADLLGDAIERAENPEYTNAVVQMARQLIGYTDNHEQADADVIAAVVAIHNGLTY